MDNYIQENRTELNLNDLLQEVGRSMLLLVSNHRQKNNIPMERPFPCEIPMFESTFIRNFYFIPNANKGARTKMNRDRRS